MAATIKLNTDPEEPSSFDIYDEDGKAGEMIFGLEGQLLTIYHTEVEPEKEGKGYAKMMLEATVAYAREHQFKVIAMCPYVYTVLSHHPEQYADIWEQPN